MENQCQEDNFRFLKLKNLLFTVEIKGRELRKIILRTNENKDELKNEINKSLLNEVYTNKATTEYRETKLANLRVIIRKPYCEIDTENVATLQFLDLIKEVVDISEVDGEELTNRLII